MNGNHKDLLDIEEQLYRIAQLEADTEQKWREMNYQPFQIYLSAVLAAAAAVTAVFAGIKVLLGH